MCFYQYTIYQCGCNVESSPRWHSPCPARKNGGITCDAAGTVAPKMTNSFCDKHKDWWTS